MVNWLLLASLWLVAIIPILACVRWLDRRSWPAWKTALEPGAQEHYEYMVRHVEGALTTIDATMGLARARHQEGNQHEGARVLHVALWTIESFVPTLVSRIEHWRAVSRAVLALHPVAPLKYSAFRLWSLSGLAALHSALDAVLVTSVERFGLRARILLGGFAIVLRATRKLGRRLGSGTSSWRRVEDVAADFGTLSRESLNTLHALLVSLPVAPVRPARPKASAPESVRP